MFNNSGVNRQMLMEIYDYALRASRECNRISQRKHLSGVLEKRTKKNGKRNSRFIATEMQVDVVLLLV